MRCARPLHTQRRPIVRDVISAPFSTKGVFLELSVVVVKAVMQIEVTEIRFIFCKRGRFLGSKPQVPEECDALLEWNNRASAALAFKPDLNDHGHRHGLGRRGAGRAHRLDGIPAA